MTNENMIDSLKILLEDGKNVQFSLKMLYLSGQFPNLKDLMGIAKQTLLDYQLKIVYFSNFENPVTEDDETILCQMQSASNGIKIIIQTAFPNAYKI